MLPLYKINSTSLSDTLAPDAHAGLWFERFFDCYDDNCVVGKDEKSNWLKQHFSRKIGDQEGLQHLASQQLSLTKALNGRAQVYKTNWHFVSGMGNPHPVENGLNWHPTTGAPYLSGAAVKGLLRSWLEVWEPQETEAAQKHQLLDWFGSDHKDPKKQQSNSLAGQLIFFDAIPIKPVQMQVDIMTPHMSKWYEKGMDINDISTQPESIPADWHNPIPIPFLVVKEAQFLFSVALRKADNAQKINLDYVMDILEQALTWQGIGAKTAVGYGQIQADPNALKALKMDTDKQQQQRLADEARNNMTDFERKLDDICRQDDNPPLTLLRKLEAGEWSNSDEQQIVAEKAKELWIKKNKWIPNFNGTNAIRVQQKGRCLELLKYMKP